MMMREREICPCCSCSAEQELLYVVNGWLITRCRTCGAGRSRGNGFDAKTYYGEAYFKGGHNDGYFDYGESEPVLRAEFKRLARDLAAVVRPGSRLLEVGCAYGYFLREAGQYFETVGIEISDAAVEVCNAAGLTNVLCGTLDSIGVADVGMFDAVVMLDVIEHLENPLGDLRKLAGLLRPNGILFLTTGDFSSCLARFIGPRWRLMTPPQHQWFFTPQALRSLSHQCGLEVESVHHRGKRVPLALALFQVKRMLGLTRLGVPAFFNEIGVPVNLFDAMQVTIRKRIDRPEVVN